jgi:ABC-2 type transport system permease protein
MNKEVKQHLRNRRVLAISFVVPLLLTTLVGLAFSGEIKQIPTIVINGDNSPSSWLLLDMIKSRGVLNPAYYAVDLDHARRLIRDGKAKVAILIPSSFAENLRSGQAFIYVLVDGSDSLAASMASSEIAAVSMILSGVQVQVLREILFNPKLSSLPSIVPAIVGLVLQILPAMQVALGISEERERGTIEQLVVTPIGVFDILIGKLLVVMAIGLIQGGLMLVVLIFGFGQVIRGDSLLLVLFILVFLLASLGLGVLISVVSRTQLQAVQTLIPIVILSVFLSGVFYPIDSMPAYLRPVSYLIPLTYMNHAMRAIVIKGAGLEAVFTDLGVLSLYGIIVFVLAVLSFRKRLD